MSSLSINTNLNALSAQRHISSSAGDMETRLNRMASALQINTAADDAAGLAISEGMSAQIRGTSQSVQNLQDGVSMLQTAEGGVSGIQENLHRMRELSIQASNDIIGDAGRSAIQAEMDQIVEEIDRSVETVTFNERELLSGDAEAAIELHAGPDRDETVSISISEMSTEALGVDEIDVTEEGGAGEAIEALNTAINQVSTERANIGSVQNRLEGAIDFLEIMEENVMASESQIRDADMAAEATELAQDQITTQAGVSTLGQAMNLEGSTASQLLS